MKLKKGMNRTYDAMMQISNLTNYETKEMNKVIKKSVSKHIYKTTKWGEKYWSNLNKYKKNFSNTK
jgi:hypothetical protein